MFAKVRVARIIGFSSAKFASVFDDAARFAGRERDCRVQWFIGNGPGREFDFTLCAPGVVPRPSGLCEVVDLSEKSYEDAVQVLRQGLLRLIDAYAVTACL